MGHGISAGPDRGRGKAYVRQQETGKRIILFVLEQSEDEHGRAMGFVNLGPVDFESSHGERPMNFTWRLKEPLPPYLWSDAAKLAEG